MKVRIRLLHAAFKATIANDQSHPLWQRLRSAAILLGLLGLALANTAYCSQTESKPTLRVRVVNHTRATSGTLAQAEHEAARILGEVGLKTVWLDCPLVQTTVVPQDPCLQPVEGNEIELRVLSDKTRIGYQDNAFGFAVAPLLASVYYEHAERLAMIDDAKFELPIILGCVVVHEIGHLLLGYNGHSGIMQSRWERKQVRQLMMGGLTFNTQQSKRMQTEVRTRMSRMPNPAVFRVPFMALDFS
jgi:hypothetical protein